MSAEASDKSLVITVKLIHVFGGIYIWEFVTTLGFEWDVYTGKRPWRWSFGVYLLCRWLAISAIILGFIGFNVTAEINCGAWLRCLLVASYFAAALASLLILLRGVAVWGRNWAVITLTAIVWLTNIGFSIYTVQQGSTAWVPAVKACAVTDTSQFRWGVLVNLLSDFALLAIMFAGVLNKRNSTGLWRVLYIQGLSWIVIAACSEIPEVIMGFLNIDDGWNLMFSVPHLVIIVTVATRVYRDLFEYILPTATSRVRFPKPPGRGAAEAAMQVTIHKTVEVDVDLPESENQDFPDHLISRGEREAKQMYFDL